MIPAELTPGQRVYRCEWHYARSIVGRAGTVDIPAEFKINEAEVVSVAPVSAVLKHFWEHGKPTTHRLMEGALRDWYPSIHAAIEARIERAVKNVERLHAKWVEAEADLVLMHKRRLEKL